MTQKYAQADVSGNIIAYFDDSINSAAQIGSAIKITDTQWTDCISNPGKWIVVNGALQLAPAPTAAALLAVAKTAQIASLTTSYNAAIQLNVAYMGTTFQADKGSQDTLVKSLSGGATYAPTFWQDVTNAKITMTFAQLQGLAGAMIAQGLTAFNNLQTKKASVNAASTVSAVTSVVW